MERIEMVEKVRERANVTFEEAKAALERNNWDLLDTMVELERLGKIDRTVGAGARMTSGGNGAQHYEQVNPTASGGQYGAGSAAGNRSSARETWQKIWSKIEELFKKSLSNSFVVSKEGEVLVRIPVLLMIVLVLAAFWLTAIVLIVGLFFDLRYSFEGKELGKDSINNTMGKATDFAQQIVREVKEDIDSQDGENRQQ